MFTSDEDEDIEEFAMTEVTEDSRLIGSPTIAVSSLNSNISQNFLDLYPNTGAIAVSSSKSGEYDKECSGDEENTIFSTPKAKRSQDNPNDASEMTTPYMWILTISAAIGGFLFGYDTGVISGAMLLLKDEFSLSSVWQELIVSITIGAAAVFSFCSGFLNDRFGRKVVILSASFVFTVGAVVLGVAQNKEMLLIGRGILGAGIGFSSMTVPVYIAECAPTHLRGRLVTINTLFITGGQCVAGVLDGAFSYIKPNGWRFMLGLAGVPSVIQFIGFLFLPESPRWLMKHKREEEARRIMIKLRGPVAVEQELMEMKNAVELESDTESSGELNILRVFRTGPVRRALVVGCGLQLFQQLCGINTVMYYSATIIKMAGVGDQHLAIWLSAVTAAANFLFSIVGIWLVERLGRKKLLLYSLVGVTFSLVILALAFQLAALNAPSSTDWIQDNSTCSSYRSCHSCIRNSDCGFCYLDKNGAVNGSCLAVDQNDDYRAKDGQCKKSHPSLDLEWSFGYCPTSYSWIAILGLVLYLAFFAPGMGPMPWTINSEIYPLWARSSCTSLATATNWVANLLVSMTFLTLLEVLTEYGTYWLFVGICVLGIIFFVIFVPETKGRTLENVDQLFSEPWCQGCCNGKAATSISQYTPLSSDAAT